MSVIGFKFPSKAAIKEFYNSKDDQALMPLRTSAANVVFTAYDIVQEAPQADMGALLAVDLIVKDAPTFQRYGQASGPIVQLHGGKLRLRAGNPEVLFGAKPHQMLVLFSFPNQGAMQTFYHSDAYQKLIPTRTVGVDVIFTGYDL